MSRVEISTPSATVTRSSAWSTRLPPGSSWSVVTSSVTGSISTVPSTPRGADTSKVPPCRLTCRFELTSTKPPSPPASPPRALTWPRWVVTSFDHTATLPPSPSARPSARMVVPSPTTTRRPVFASGCPASSAPMRTLPPRSPLASIVAPSSSMTSPAMSTVPPWPDAFDTSSPPLTRVVPSPPSSTMDAPVLRMLPPTTIPVSSSITGGSITMSVDSIASFADRSSSTANRSSAPPVVESALAVVVSVSSTVTTLDSLPVVSAGFVSDESDAAVESLPASASFALPTEAPSSSVPAALVSIDGSTDVEVTPVIRAFRLPALVSMRLLTLIFLPASRLTSSLPAVETIGALTSMRLCASRVSAASPPSVFSMDAATVMLPSPSPSAEVFTDTLPPVFNVASMDVALALSMTMSSGSSSQVPPAPAGALTSTGTLNSRTRLPEVSTKPPSPPSSPPRALMRPSTRVVSSDQTMTRPPSPRPSASA